MKNNRKAYRIYMALSPESKKTLSFEYDSGNLKMLSKSLSFPCEVIPII